MAMVECNSCKSIIDSRDVDLTIDKSGLVINCELCVAQYLKVVDTCDE